MAQPVVVDALFKLLRPLVRIMLRNGVPVSVFEDVVRRVFVNVADHDFRVEGRRQSVSRISVLTGLNRKEVSRLRALPEGNQLHEARHNRAERVLTSWISDPLFLDEKGDPRILSFEGDNSFSELVRLYSGDMTPRAVLDELVRVGNVEHMDSGEVRLLSRGYLPKAQSEESVVVFGTHARDILATFDRNLAGAPPEPLFQRQVTYNAVPVEHTDSFLRFSSRVAQRTLEEMDAWLSEHPATGDSTTVRLGLGIYQVESQSNDPSGDLTQ